jgi:two-component system chemotaxis response regulator CheY
MINILIVDDSLTLRSELKNFLLENNFNVLEAENGEEGLKVLSDAFGKSIEIHTLILDVNMPVMDGPTMCEKIVEDKNFAHIPILMLTTEARPELKEKVKQLGVRAWITKPFVPDKFLLGLKKMLKKEGHLKDEIL